MKTTKIVPFDIELARKIYTGEVNGRIVTKNSNFVAIYRFDMKHKLYKVLGVIVYRDKSEEGATFTAEGKYRYNDDGVLDLVIELQTKEFEKGDIVLGRCNSHEPWTLDVFVNEIESGKVVANEKVYQCVRSFYRECIPYDGNENKY